jgi:hypothetical protein
MTAIHRGPIQRSAAGRIPSTSQANDHNSPVEFFVGRRENSIALANAAGSVRVSMMPAVSRPKIGPARLGGTDIGGGHRPGRR